MRWLAVTGELALTVYFAHVLLGMGILDEIGRLEDQTLLFALTSAGAFYVSAVAFSVWWRRSHRRGPVEWLMRRLSG